MKVQKIIIPVSIFLLGIVAVTHNRYFPPAAPAKDLRDALNSSETVFLENENTKKILDNFREQRAGVPPVQPPEIPAVALVEDARAGLDEAEDAGRIPQRLKSDWGIAAEGLLKAIKERKSVVLPMAVNGVSLVPREILADIKRMHPAGVIFLGDLVVGKSERANEFAISFNYLPRDSRTEYTNETYASRFYVWYAYLKAGLRDSSEQCKFDPAKPDDLPEPLPPSKNSRLLKQLKENDFNVERTLGEYIETFGTPLRKSLSRLNQDSVWIDMGAGSAMAQRTFLSNRLRKKDNSSGVPKLIAVAYNIPEDYIEAVKKAEESSNGKFAYIEGKQGPTTIQRMAPVDLITDICGIYLYTTSPKLSILQAYVGILKSGGAIFIDPLFADDVDIVHWLDKQGDLSYEEVHSEEENPGEPGRLIIRKK